MVLEVQHPKWRAIFAALLGGDPNAHRSALSELWDATTHGRPGAQRAQEFAVTAADGARILQIALSTELPGSSPEATGTRIVEWFWDQRDALFPSAIRTNYQNAHARVQGAALVVLAAQGTTEAMAVARELLNEHGLPSGMYYRFFHELGKHIELATDMLPELLEHSASGEFLPSVVDLINVALERKRLDVRALLAGRDALEKRAIDLLRKAECAQRPGSRRVEDLEVRASLGASLDLLGAVSGDSNELLSRAQHLQDPHIVMVAAVALLRQGVESAASVWRRIASADETRATVYRMLRPQGRLDLFPPEFLTLGAFAACDMVEWLSHPGELGGAPDELEEMGRLVGTTPAGDQIHFLWRFTVGEKKYAGISGPYSTDAPAEPLSGEETFSNFEEWDSATPEAHFESISRTLTRWSIEWCRSPLDPSVQDLGR